MLKSLSFEKEFSKLLVFVLVFTLASDLSDWHNLVMSTTPLR